MSKLQKIIDDILKNSENLYIHEMLYLLRNECGIKLSKAAEMSGMHLERLKRLENGTFRRMPEDKEIDCICKMWGLDKKVVKKKLHDYIESFNNKKKFGSKID